MILGHARHAISLTPMQNQTLKVQGARFVLTIDPQRRIIQDGSVLIEGQRITRVGKADELAEVPAASNYSHGHLLRLVLRRT